MWILAYIIYDIGSTYKAKSRANAYSYKYHKSGFAFEYKIRCEKSNEAKGLYKTLSEEIGEENARIEIARRCNVSLKYDSGKNIYDIIQEYSVRESRNFCYAINAWPKCAFDVAGKDKNIIFGAKLKDTRIYFEYYDFHGGFNFEEDEYRRLQEIDSEWKEECIKKRKSAGIWTGEFESFDEFLKFTKEIS